MLREGVNRGVAGIIAGLILIAAAFHAPSAEGTFFHRRFYRPYYYTSYYRPYYYRPYYYRPYYYNPYSYYGYNPYLAAYLGYYGGRYGGYSGYGGYGFGGYGNHGWYGGYGIEPNIYFTPQYHLYHETPFQKPLETGRIKYWQAGYGGIEKVEDLWYEKLTNGAKNAIRIDDYTGKPYGYQFEDAVHDLRSKLWEKYKAWKEGGAPLPEKAQKFLLWYWNKFGGTRPEFGYGYAHSGSGSGYGGTTVTSHSWSPSWSSGTSYVISSPTCVDCSAGFVTGTTR